MEAWQNMIIKFQWEGKKMKWFSSLKVGGKLTLSFTVMILLIGIIGLTGYRSASNINQKLDDIFSVMLPSMGYLLEADRDLHQLLVAERSMIFTEVSSELFGQLLEEYESNMQQAEARWEKYKALAATADEKAMIPKFEAARQEWKQLTARIIEARKANTVEGRREALDLTVGQTKEKFEEMRGYIDQLTEINQNLSKEASESASRTFRSTVMMIFAITGLGLLAGVLMIWFMKKGITKPLRRVIEGLTESACQVTSGSAQVASSSQSLAEGSAEQAASLEETSSSLEEMASMTKQNAGNANEADGLMKEGTQTVDKANRSMNELNSSMGEISKASEETSKIIKTIDEIAFQTNLLALNAAVEAARAGEAGAGFAVVADEVRNLALRAADAAKNTSGLIEQTIKQIQEGSEIVEKTNEAFGQVYESSTKVAELVGEIAAASNEQAQGVDQVNRAVAEMDKVVQNTAANAEESAAASEEMSAQAEQMNQFVHELVNLVGKNRTGGNGKKNPHVDTLTTPQRSLSVPAVKAVSQGHGTANSTPIHPDHVIPMDDSEFKDF
jgi:methyl-accepting chemotaxis protein